MKEIEFIKLVKRLRIMKRINQKQMANILQIPASSYCRLENGIYKLNFYQIRVLAETLDIDLNIIKEEKNIEKIVFFD